MTLLATAENPRTRRNPIKPVEGKANRMMSSIMKMTPKTYVSTLAFPRILFANHTYLHVCMTWLGMFYHWQEDSDAAGDDDDEDKDESANALSKEERGASGGAGGSAETEKEEKKKARKEKKQVPYLNVRW